MIHADHFAWLFSCLSSAKSFRWVTFITHEEANSIIKYILSYCIRFAHFEFEREDTRFEQWRPSRIVCRLVTRFAEANCKWKITSACMPLTACEDQYRGYIRQDSTSVFIASESEDALRISGRMISWQLQLSALTLRRWDIVFSRCREDPSELLASQIDWKSISSSVRDQASSSILKLENTSLSSDQTE